MITYEHDSNLPQLPIPDLSETLEDLKNRVHPLVDEEDYIIFCRELDTFCTQNGAGVKLQEKLIAWQNSLPGNSSWLRPFWDDTYLSFQDSLPQNMNYTLQLKSDLWTPDALSRFTAAMVNCIQMIRGEHIPPETAGKVYNSMDTMGGMFYTRIPAPLRDVWSYTRLTDPLTAAVCCRGHWFILSLSDQEGKTLPPKKLAAAFEQIRLQASVLPIAEGVMSYSCADRKTAGEERTALSAYKLNRLSLESIEKTVLVICLDEESDGASNEASAYGKQILTGDAANRCFDKSIQLISTGGKLAVSLEHSGCDGMIWAYFLGLVNEEALQPREDFSASEVPAQIRLLEWIVPNSIRVKLKDIQEGYAQWSNTLSFEQKTLPALTKGRIKQLKCSPDAVLQLLFQTVYYRLTGKLGSVYEAVSTRTFCGGRTECVRSVTMASKSYLEALEGGASTAEILDKFHQAVQQHRENIGRCKEGLGGERHLTGLQCMHEMYTPDQPLPDLFQTKGYLALKHDVLSTSSILGSAIDYFAFVPVVVDGLGIGYGLSDSGLDIAVSAYQKSGIDPAVFIEKLEEAGEELFRISID